jgi:hypothetical protein
LARRGRKSTRKPAYGVFRRGACSTFATWCKDEGVHAELQEMALTHAEGQQGGGRLQSSIAYWDLATYMKRVALTK